MHSVVVYKEKYVDPSKSAHTQAIERAWVEVRVGGDDPEETSDFYSRI